MNEAFFCEYVKSGILEIDQHGRIWKIADRVWDRRTRTSSKVQCAPRRAESLRHGYLYMGVNVGGKSLQALAHRVVWWHFKGPIPIGLTINHINGDKTCNDPSNLELATYKELALKICPIRLIQ